MAWYYGTFSCGHEGRVNVIGPNKNRQYIIDRKFEGLCPECYAKKMAEEREKANKEAEEKRKKWELEELEGTEKQIAWANTIRINFIEQVNKIAEERENEHFENTGKHSKKALRYIETLDYMLRLEKTKKATYWINTRLYNPIEMIDEFKQEYKETNGFKEGKEETVEKEVVEEGTVKPQIVKYDGVVKITVNDDIISANYEKNDTFISTVKSLNYKWNGAEWQRKIKEMSGTIEDRVAELGNKLLYNGFSISILDKDMRDKAVKGDYEDECDRWITYNEDTKKLKIRWFDDSDLYDTAKKLSGAKWKDRGMLVDVSHYEELQDFADKLNFKFTKKALEKIREYKEQFEKVDTVNVFEHKEEAKEDKLKNILNSSTDVLNDLREDD